MVCWLVSFEVGSVQSDVVDLKMNWMKMIPLSWQEMEDEEDPPQLYVLFF